MTYRKLATGCAAIAFAVIAAHPAMAEADDRAGADDQGQRSDIIVTGAALRDAIVAGKADIPLLETPQAVSVVSAADIEARGVTRLSEALRTVAGISRSTTYGFYDAYTIRGFDAAYGSVYLDGLVNEAGVGLNQELSAIEQIEVLKGPASMLFGQAPLGGLINLVSKRPQAEAFLKAAVSTGSWNLIEGTVDANAPLDSSGNLLARINLTYRDAGSFVRNAGVNRIFVAPAVTWRIGPDTTLTVLGRYQRDRDNPISPLPSYGTVLPGLVDIPQDFAINGAGDQRAINNRNRVQIGYVFDHAFSEALGFSQTLRWTRRKEYWDRWMFAAGFVAADGTESVVRDENGDPIYDKIGYAQEIPTGTIGRTYFGPQSAIDKDLAVDTRLKGKFATGAVSHEWLAGIDYRRNRGSYVGGGDYDPTHFPLDIANPDYGTPYDTQFVFVEEGATRGHQTGIYIQDHIRFGDFATLTLGGRYDWATAEGQKDHAFSPRIGATVKLAPGVNAYASWSKSFLPQLYDQQVIGLSDDGQPIGGPVTPERGKNLELGVKFAPDGVPLSGSLAVYQLTRQNVTTPDPTYLDFVVVSGEQRARGFEAELRWQPFAGLDLAFAYTYVDAKITKDNRFTIGAPLANVPKNNVGVFVQYEVQDGPMAGLGATLGVTYISRRNGDHWATQPDGSVLLWLPSYTLVDAGLSYRREGWGVQLTVANLFDKRYFPDTGGIDRVTPGNPRNWRLTLSKEI